MNELFKISAVQAVDLLKSGEISPIDLIEEAITRIETVDERINALPIRCFERERQQAINAKISCSNQPNYLYGLPIAVKDYNDVGGVRTTYGSPIYAENVPEKSDATVCHLENNGAIPIAKSNVPEWAGGHTFNPLFGITRNPWNLKLSAGGSSGGSAAALASGMVWLATGNDLGGSLRTPAAFNGVIGCARDPGLLHGGKGYRPLIVFGLKVQWGDVLKMWHSCLTPSPDTTKKILFPSQDQKRHFQKPPKILARPRK